jgi:hypothetical protein
MKRTIMLVSLVFAGISFLGACASEPTKPAAPVTRTIAKAALSIFINPS